MRSVGERSLTRDVCGSGLAEACNQMETHASPAAQIRTYWRSEGAQTAIPRLTTHESATAPSSRGLCQLLAKQSVWSVLLVRGSSTVGFLRQGRSGWDPVKSTRGPAQSRNIGQFFFSAQR